MVQTFFVIYLCIAVFVSLLVCFTEEVSVKPLKNQNFLKKETAFESISYIEKLLPFPFHTPPLHVNPGGARASIMNG